MAESLLLSLWNSPSRVSESFGEIRAFKKGKQLKTNLTLCPGVQLSVQMMLHPAKNKIRGEGEPENF